MTRNLKALGLTLVAVFALSAMTASAASAAPAKFTANSHLGVAGIHGAQIGTDTFKIEFLPALTCAKAEVNGTAITPGTESTYVELKPTYDTCHIQAPLIGTKTATVTTNGCEYTINATKQTNSTGTPAHAGAPTPQALTPFSADLHITCPDPNKGIEVHVYNDIAHAHNKQVLCTYDIVPQTVLNQIELTNTATHDVEAHIHAKVAVTNTILGGICGNSHHTTAIYKGKNTLTATNSEGISVGSTVS